MWLVLMWRFVKFWIEFNEGTVSIFIKITSTSCNINLILRKKIKSPNYRGFLGI